MPEGLLIAVLFASGLTMFGTAWFMNNVCKLRLQVLIDDLEEAENELRVVTAKADALQEALDRLAAPA